MTTRQPGQAVADPPSTAPGPQPSRRQARHPVGPVRLTPTAVNGRRRLIVEFAGTPRAGKTSAMHGLDARLRARGHRVYLIDERALLSPVPSTQHPDFNLWTATMTSALVLEAMHAEADVVLVDRGLFDALCWMDWYRHLGHLTEHEHDVVSRFLCVRPLRQRIQLVLVMTVEPNVALEREYANRPPGCEKGAGTVMNAATLRDLNASIGATVARHRDQFTLVALDTTKSDQAQTLELVAAEVQRLVLPTCPVGPMTD